MPCKPTKCGINIWMAADSENGFVINREVNLGKENIKVVQMVLTL